MPFVGSGLNGLSLWHSPGNGLRNLGKDGDKQKSSLIGYSDLAIYYYKKICWIGLILTTILFISCFYVFIFFMFNIFLFISINFLYLHIICRHNGDFNKAHERVGDNIFTNFQWKF